MARRTPSTTDPRGRQQALSLLLFASHLYLPALLLLAVVVLVRLLSDPLISFDYMMRDPAAIMEEKFYIGLVSNVGILFWCGTVAVCFVTFFSVGGASKRNVSYLFLFGGVLSAILLLDDAFLLHEDVFPNYLSVPKNLALLGYGALLILFLAYFRSVIAQTAFPLLLVSLLFFGLSLAVDVMDENELWTMPASIFLEDSSKFLGIVGWLAYFSRTAIAEIRSRVA